jgi:hypothetical protein
MTGIRSSDINLKHSEDLSCENFSSGLECKRSDKIIASAIEEANPIKKNPAEVFLK